MSTSFEEVIDMALLTIKDYKLDEIYTENNTAFSAITEGFLLRGLPQFYNCKTDLSYDLTNKTFNNTLKPLEISILADLWIEQWLRNQINNVSQLQNKMSPTDFKHYSEAENLKQKSEYLDKIREKYKQEMLEYGYLNVNWTDWGNGIF